MAQRGWSMVLAGCCWVLLLDPALRHLGAAAVRGTKQLQDTIAWNRLSPEEIAASTASLEREAARLRAATQQLAETRKERLPEGPYIVVDTRSNRLLVREGDQVLLEAVCSTGSGRELVAGKHRWVFDTPRGRRKVLSKHYLPVWIKPDWAFYEEGDKPPARTSPERYEEAVLGEYALNMGNGYLIHGTLYKRFLGQSVTHGCVRLDDTDLEFVYQTAKVGTPIYIF